MTESNVEIWKRVIAAFNEGGPDAVLEYFAPDVEVYDPDLPEGMPTRGPEAVRYLIEQLMSGFVSLQVMEAEMIPAGDRVVGLIDTHARGSGTRGEMALNMRTAHCMTFRDGLITYWRLYVDHNEALADAGLPPRSVQPRGHPDPGEGGGHGGGEAP